MEPLEPSETELARYVEARLGQMGRNFADPKVVAETLAEHHDLWLSLYKVDHDDPIREIANRS